MDDLKLYHWTARLAKFHRAFFWGTMMTLVLAFAQASLTAQSGDSPFRFDAEAAIVTKYIWRGQRLTDDWSFQPTGTVGIGDFSVNVWGTLDLTAVNPGDSLFLPDDPSAPAGEHAGLRGKFSEIDYTFSYAHSFEEVTLDMGAIIYTFPERSASLPSTTEIYGGISFDSIPLSPSATLYLDVDETGGGASDPGIYFALAAQHSFPISHAKGLQGIDLSGRFSFVNSGFADYYYGANDSGAHDLLLTVAAPFSISSSVSASVFVSYSALLGDFRGRQYLNPREVLRGTAGTPAGSADTFWGGAAVQLAFR